MVEIISKIREQWNVANAVTTLRILMVPVLVAVLFTNDGESAALRWWAAVIFLLTALTDRLDGYLARSRGLETDLGRLLDPIADKLLVGLALVGLAIIGDLPWWIVVVILVREVAITVLRFVLLRVEVIPASSGGKIKTGLQVAAITLFLMPLWALPQFVTVLAWILLVVALLITVATGVQYLVNATKLVRARRG